MAGKSVVGRGMRARNMAEGRWAKTIVFSKPIRLEMEEATRLERAAMMLVVKNRVPRVPSGRENLVVKK